MTKPLNIRAIHTSLFRKGDDLQKFLIHALSEQRPQERSILAITSKIVSVAENRFVAKDSIDKQKLIVREADVDLGEIAYGCRLTIKHGLMIPSAGIDESNSENDEYILFPEDPFKSAEKIHQALSRHFGLKEFGVLITDSHTLPLRQGVVGTSLSWWGFHPVKNMVGSPDLFGRSLQMTKINIADALSVAAVYMMGEAAERCPLALIEGANVEFAGGNLRDELSMPLEQDLYRPLILGR